MRFLRSSVMAVLGLVVRRRRRKGSDTPDPIHVTAVAADWLVSDGDVPVEAHETKGAAVEAGRELAQGSDAPVIVDDERGRSKT